MKLCVFRTGTIRASWSAVVMAEKLRNMGHQVIDAPIPTNQQGQVISNIRQDEFAAYRAALPTLEQLQSCDLVICLAIEFYIPWLKTLYGDAWLELRNRVALHAESSDRLDYNAYKLFSNVQFYPDKADAEKFGGHFFPCGVDTRMFRKDSQQPRYDLAFLGTLYPSRIKFLESLSPYLKVPLTCGEVTAFDLGGECQYIWAVLNAQNINRMKIHLNLPGQNSRMTTARVLETMACGTFLLTYPTSDNLFTDKVHCKFYDPADPKGLAEMIDYYLANDKVREAIAAQGCEYVRNNFSLEKVLTDFLDKLLKPKVPSLSELTVTP
jgi:hypothetical protein